jgi:hypothetical protein
MGTIPRAMIAFQATRAGRGGSVIVTVMMPSVPRALDLFPRSPVHLSARTPRQHVRWATVDPAHCPGSEVARYPP